MGTNNQKILNCLSKQLLNKIDSVTSKKQVSRSAFIRESLVRNLHYYNKYERGPVCFPREDIEVTFGAPKDKLRNLSDEDCQRSPRPPRVLLPVSDCQCPLTTAQGRSTSQAPTS